MNFMLATPPDKPKCVHKVPNPDYRSIHRWRCKILNIEGPAGRCPTCILYKPEAGPERGLS